MKENTQIALIKKDLEYIKQRLAVMDSKLEGHYVSKEELALAVQRIILLEKIVYGLVGIILTSVVIALVTLVLV